MNELEVEASPEGGHTIEVKIIVNTREEIIHSKEISFAEVTHLAFPNLAPGPNVEFTVTYRKGIPSKPEGSLVTGQSVEIRDGMVFVVTATDKS